MNWVRTPPSLPGLYLYRAGRYGEVVVYRVVPGLVHGTLAVRTAPMPSPAYDLAGFAGEWGDAPIVVPAGEAPPPPRVVTPPAPSSTAVPQRSLEQSALDLCL